MVVIWNSQNSCKSAVAVHYVQCQCTASERAPLAEIQRHLPRIIFAVKILRVFRSVHKPAAYCRRHVLSRCRCSNCDGWSDRRRLVARLCQRLSGRAVWRVFSGDAACLRSHGHGNGPRSIQRCRVAKYDHTIHHDTFIALIRPFCRWLGDRWGLRSHFIWEILLFVSDWKLFCLRALSEERQFVVR